MPSSKPAAGSPQDWLRHARSDLALARMRKTRTLLYEHLCFHAQQASEKALKAVLVHCGLQVPHSHDLTYLMGLLPEGVSIPPSLLELPILTKYAVRQRYPGETAPATQKSRRQAVSLAESAVSWAGRTIRRKHGLRNREDG